MHWTIVTLYRDLQQRMLMPHPTKLGGNTYCQLEISGPSSQFQNWQKVMAHRLHCQGSCNDRFTLQRHEQQRAASD